MWGIHSENYLRKYRRQAGYEKLLERSMTPKTDATAEDLQNNVSVNEVFYARM